MLLRRRRSKCQCTCGAQKKYNYVHLSLIFKYFSFSFPQVTQNNSFFLVIYEINMILVLKLMSSFARFFVLIFFWTIEGFPCSLFINSIKMKVNFYKLFEAGKQVVIIQIEFMATNFFF